MLEINFESGLLGGDRKFAGRCVRETLRALNICMALVVLFPVGLAAQTTSSGAISTERGMGYGTSVRNPLQFAGESQPENVVSLSFGASGLYDDNVLSVNSQRLGDEALSLSPHLSAARQSRNLVLDFNYTPYFLLYRQFSKFDRLNQSANLGLEFRVSPRFVVGVSETFGYRYGAYPSLNGADISSGPISPTDLNGLISPFTTRTLSNSSGLELTFVKSSRTSVTLSGGYNLSDYANDGGATASLYDSKGGYGSVKFNYLPSKHTSLSLRLLHQDSTYEFGSVFNQRTQTESALFAVESHLSPTLSVSVNGGPQYVHVLGQSSGVAEGFYGAGGASITEELRKTALTVSFQRSVSDGGGLYATVINNSAMFGVRRRLVGRWETGVHGGVGRARDLVLQADNNKTDYLIAGIDFRRPVRNGSELRISYDSMHETYKGGVTSFYGFDRNQVSVTFDFRLKAISLGQ